MIPAMAVAEEYARRLAVREAEVARLAKVHERIGNGRVALGVAVLVVAWAVLFERALAPVWLLVPVAAFIALVLYHSSVRGKRVSADRAADYYRHGIARLEDRWIGLGERGERFGATDHGTPTLAVHLSHQGATLAYSADSGPGWSVEELGAAIGTFLCEATYTQELEGSLLHLSGREAGAMARAAGVGRLILTHRWPTVSADDVRREAELAFGQPVEQASMGAVFAW